jgi:hypothetical protein
MTPALEHALLAILFALIFVIGLFARTTLGRFSTVKRVETPVLFWAFQFIWGAAALINAAASIVPGQWEVIFFRK